MPVIPTDAATVMLLRPRQSTAKKDIEVLLVRRNRKSRFVPDYHVYPGGILDPEDYAPEMDPYLTGLERRQATRIMSNMRDPEKAIGAWVAAVRETFEEVGILLACRRDGSTVSIETEGERERFADYRRALIQGKMKFREMLEAENLTLPLERLHFFSHWITPEPLPLRYDVRFYVTEAPERQSVMHDGVELTSHDWLRPGEALEAYEQNRIGMVLPQIMTLAELARFNSVEEVLREARDRRVQATLTKIKKVEGHDVEVMPDGEVFRGRLPIYSWPRGKQ